MKQESDARPAEPRRVAAEVLNVAPWVAELPLATPKRRFMAMAIDLLLVALVGALVWSDAGTHEGDDDSDDDAVIVSPSLSASEALAMAASAIAAASSAPSGQARTHAPAVSTDASGPASTAGRATDDAAVPVLMQLSKEELVREVRALTRQLAELRRPRAWYERGWHWLHGVIAGYGGSLVYFTFVTAFWRGRSVGKRLLGLRVVEITGKPMTLRRAFARYGGYVAGLATGGLGLAQVLWDPNRQGLQDKVAHTVVIDERGAHDPTT